MPKVIQIATATAKGDEVELFALDDVGQMFRYVWKDGKWMTMPPPTTQHR